MWVVQGQSQLVVNGPGSGGTPPSAFAPDKDVDRWSALQPYMGVQGRALLGYKSLSVLTYLSLRQTSPYSPR